MLFRILFVLVALLALAACGLVLVSAVALWRRRAWAAWAWYAIALGAFVLAGRGLVEVPSKGLAAGGSAVLWSAVGVVLLREVTAWRRALAAPVRADDGERDG